MQAVGGSLKVTPMALYRHVADKADLLDGLVESLLTQFRYPIRGCLGMIACVQLGRSMRELARSHPQHPSAAADEAREHARLAARHARRR